MLSWSEKAHRLRKPYHLHFEVQRHYNSLNYKYEFINHSPQRDLYIVIKQVYLILGFIKIIEPYEHSKRYEALAYELQDYRQLTTIGVYEDPIKAADMIYAYSRF